MLQEARRVQFNLNFVKSMKNKIKQRVIMFETMKK